MIKKNNFFSSKIHVNEVHINAYKSIVCIDRRLIYNIYINGIHTYRSIFCVNFNNKLHSNNNFNKKQK